ncbi:hypothetical protein B0H14DRAFT_2825397 [Mycena olivaceomarginata]|nr:hypothetical protein B0H14DRAFT_2825397 [Mycena olivaceomarginata]
MDGQQTTQDQQTKDFMASFFPQDLDSSTEFQFHSHPTPGPCWGTIGNLINEQTAAAASYNVNANPGLMLEQQYKLSQLQQLQQLQNQIFQQQIALISGAQPPPLPLESGSRSGPERVAPFHGLPTPGNSTELRAQSNVEYVSPMILDYSDTFNQQYVPRGSTSAPAHIAFRQTAQPDLDFDISPNTVPAIRATVPIPKRAASTRGTKSANSTPLMRSTRARKGSISVPGDTPSPVDLSMPPPAPPADSAAAVPPSPATRPQLTPVTPASIMNLGRLGIAGSFAAGKPPKKSSMPVSPIVPSPASSSSRNPNPPVGVRKTSHKAAEQKRRDSLKTTFDDLRGLLPPLPLPSDVPDEPVLPGALPPRGPPKAGGEGPNKGVSKLQLLMCGNDYIRQLVGRVERRDEEIARLRREVGYLRGVARGEYAPGGHGDAEVEECDLESDLDAIEAYGHPLGRPAGSIAEQDEEGEEEGED